MQDKKYIIEPSGKKRLAVEQNCVLCGKKFLVRKVWAEKQRFCSKECSGKNNRKRTTVKCSYCDKEFEKTKCSLNNSRSGLYFCSREHKDLAQTLNFGLREIMPDHYGTSNGESGYRRLAFRSLPHKCARCGFDEHIEILQVHHIDGDRTNNELSNLVILCPNCHAGITWFNWEL